MGGAGAGFAGGARRRELRGGQALASPAPSLLWGPAAPLRGPGCCKLRASTHSAPAPNTPFCSPETLVRNARLLRGVGGSAPRAEPLRGRSKAQQSPRLCNDQGLRHVRAGRELVRCLWWTGVEFRCALYCCRHGHLSYARALVTISNAFLPM